MNNTQEKRNDNDSKKIVTMLVLVFTLMFCTTGATYAYFAFTASAVNNVTGTAATASLLITNNTSSTSAAAPQLIAPSTSTYNTKPMVPQISYSGTTNILQNAFNGATSMDKCVDGNGNVICRAYTFVVRNMSTAAVDVRGYIYFTYGSGSTFNNLRWKLMSNATTVAISESGVSSTFSTTKAISAVTGSSNKIYFDTTNVALAANGGTKQYWLIVWIEETGVDQGASASSDTEKDIGTWYATVGFDAFNEAGTSIGGLTSTITS